MLYYNMSSYLVLFLKYHSRTYVSSWASYLQIYPEMCFRLSETHIFMVQGSCPRLSANQEKGPSLKSVGSFPLPSTGWEAVEKYLVYSSRFHLEEQEFRGEFSSRFGGTWAYDDDLLEVNICKVRWAVLRQEQPPWRWPNVVPIVESVSPSTWHRRTMGPGDADER